MLQRMGAALCHRGPDAEGIHEDHAGRPAVGLVHRRLSIIDLSAAANQPLAGEDGRVLVMLNGEIYNFQELRASLATGHTFRTHGDTEVIAHGYEDRGDEIAADIGFVIDGHRHQIFGYCRDCAANAKTRPEARR